MNHWCICAVYGFLLFTTTSTGRAVEVWQRFNVLDAETGVRFGQLDEVRYRKSASGTLVLVLRTPEASQLPQALRTWQPDPILREISVTRAVQDTVELTVRARKHPACDLRWSRDQGALVVRAALTEPADADFYREAGLYLASRGEKERALAQLRKALALAPHDSRIQKDLAEVRKRSSIEAQAVTHQRETMRVAASENPPAAKVPLPAAQAVDLCPDTGAASSAVLSTEMITIAEKRDDERDPALTTREGDPSMTAKPRAPEGVRKETSPRAAGRLTAVGASAFLAGGLMVPLIVVLAYLRKKGSSRRREASEKAHLSDLEISRMDVFQSLLAERLARQGSIEGEQASIEGSEPVSESPFEPEEGIPGEPELRRVEDAWEAGEAAGRSRPKREVRGELESILALADRGFSVEEIARRLHMGKEEVRLALQVRRSRTPLSALSRRGQGIRLHLVEG